MRPQGTYALVPSEDGQNSSWVSEPLASSTTMVHTAHQHPKPGPQQEWQLQDVIDTIGFGAYQRRVLLVTGTYVSSLDSHC